jgi:hypothetical protein
MLEAVTPLALIGVAHLSTSLLTNGEILLRGAVLGNDHGAEPFEAFS